MLVVSEYGKTLDEAVLAQEIETRLKQAAAKATGSATRVRRVIILPRDPSFDQGEITEKGSLNQRALRAHSSELIDTLYAGGDGVIAV